MNLEALIVRHAPIRGPEWVLAGVAIAALAVVAWETWEAKIGTTGPC